MKITLYTVSNCEFSKQEKDYLASHNLPFEEKNLESNRDFLTEMLSISNNFAGTPVTKVEKDDGQISILKGFTKEEFDQTLGAAATPQAPPVSQMNSQINIPTEPEPKADTSDQISQSPTISQPVQPTIQQTPAQQSPPEPTIQNPEPVKVQEEIPAVPVYEVTPSIPETVEPPIIPPIEPPLQNQVTEPVRSHEDPLNSVLNKLGAVSPAESNPPVANATLPKVPDFNG